MFGDWEASIDRQVYKGSTSRKGGRRLFRESNL